MSLSPTEPVSAAACLSRTQEHVLAQLSAGATLRAAAESAGIHRNTIAYWRRSSLFRDALHQAHYEKAIHWREQAETLAAAALETIRAVMTDPKAPASARLKAALAILEKASTPPPAPPEIVHKNAQKPESTPLESTPEFVRAETVPKNAQNIETRPTKPTKIGRNDACPCGSGRKFKHCCLDKPAPASDSAASFTPDPPPGPPGDVAA